MRLGFISVLVTIAFTRIAFGQSLSCTKLSDLTCDTAPKSDITGEVQSEAAVTEKLKDFWQQVKVETTAEMEAALGRDPKLRKDVTDYLSRSQKGSLAETMAQLALHDADFTNEFDASVLNELGLKRLRDHPVFVEASKRIKKKARERLLPAGAEDVLRQKVFPQVTAQISEVIKKVVIHPGIKRRLLNRFSTMTFKGSNCELIVKDKGPTGAMLAAQAYYDDKTNSFTYCGGLLQRSQSEFQMVMVLAHELSHSIDPCNIGLNFKNTPDFESALDKHPFGNLLRCLRGTDSVAAKNRDAIIFEEGRESDRVKCAELEAISRLPKSCDPKHKKFWGTRKMESREFCYGNDQIGEAFCDWMATEQLAQYLSKNHPQISGEEARAGYANALRIGYCEPKAGVEKGNRWQGPHLPMRTRVDRILAAHPIVRTQMRCAEAPEATHCTNNPITPAEGFAAPAAAEVKAPSEVGAGK